MLKKASLLLIVSLLFSLPASAKDNKWHKKNKPENYSKVLVLIADKPIHSPDGSMVVDGLIAGDGMGFFKGVLGWSEEIIEKDRQMAIEFFKKRYGLNINDPRLVFSGYEINPNANYRIVLKSGSDVSKKGIPILDGGWALVVMDPAGVELGGEFAGRHIPAGSMMVFGHYAVKYSKHKMVVIDMQSRGPMQPVGNGMVMDCEFFHPHWGRGVGWGLLETPWLPNGLLQTRVHTTLTFPGFGFEEQMMMTDD